MKKAYAKKAVQNCRKAGGNFKTGPRIALKKEADLAAFYYPGILEVLEKIKGKAAQQDKLCSYNRTVAVLSSKGPDHYPLLTAKAALISQVADVNALPLMIKYDKVKQIGSVIRSLAHNFQAILCVDFSPMERMMAESTYSGDSPLLFHDQLEAGAVVAGVMATGKMMKKTGKKLNITVEGAGPLSHDIIHQLTGEKYELITLLDNRGPLYTKRPNMNRYKKALASMLKKKKDARTRKEVLAETDVYINTEAEKIDSSHSSSLPDKSVIICTRAMEIEKSKKQALISTLPMYDNHITDLHLAAGIVEALCDGKKWTQKTLSQAIHALSRVFKTPKANHLLPGLLDKNLAKKIAKGIK
jgi:malic enzyme